MAVEGVDMAVERLGEARGPLERCFSAQRAGQARRWAAARRPDAEWAAGRSHCRGARCGAEQGGAADGPVIAR